MRPPRSLLARLLIDAREGSRLAVVSPGRDVTRQALLDEAGRVAAAIRAAGVGGPESRVGLFLDRGPEWLAAALGAWGMGAAWVPVSPDWPAARSRQVLADAGASLVLTANAHAQAVGNAWAGPVVLVDGPLPDADRSALSLPAPGTLAYVMYTSGSTGRPKGVAVEHRHLDAYLDAALGRYPVTAGDAVPFFTSPAADLSVTSALLPLAAGVAVRPYAGASALADLVADLRAGCWFSLLKLTPSHLDLLLYDLLGHDVPRPPSCLVVGGEALRSAAVRAWWARWPATRVFNEYGPTEATVGCCVHEVTARDLDGVTVPIGRPLGASTLHLADASVRAVAGEGELFIGGPQVARGYLGQPALSAIRFVPDTFGTQPGGRLYRTGDRVRQRDDGVLEFLGRTDRQVKVRGHRVEPAEIEAALLVIPGVEHAAVLPQEVPGEHGTRLVAYLAGHALPDEDVVRAHLANRLPAALVPARFVAVSALPLTDSGKVDAAALLALERTTPADEAAPTTALGHLLAACRHVLGRRDVGERDGFLALGGDSLAAARVGARLRAAGFSLPLDALLTATAIGDLAARVVPTRSPSATPAPPGRPREPQGWWELSSGQQRLLYLWQAAPGDPSYNVASALALDGALDTGAIRTAVAGLVRRHAMLRARFDVAHHPPRQRVDLEGPALEVCDVPADAREPALLDWGNRPFDLVAGPPSRFVLLRHGPASATLLACAHHIVVDRWSMDTLLADLAALYAAARAGTSAALPALPASFADHVTAERALTAHEAAKAYWRGVTAEPATRLLRDRVRADDHRAAVVVRPLRRSGEFREACRRLDLTPFMGLAAHVARWLAHATGTDEARFGTIEAGRVSPAFEPVVGFFANTVPLRVPVDDHLDWRTQASRVRDLLLESSRHTLPLARIVEVARQAHGDAGATDFDVVLVLQNTPRAPAPWPRLRVSPVRVPPASAKFPLTLFVELDETGDFTFEAEYRAGSFDQATVEAWLRHLEAAVHATIDTPGLKLAEVRRACASPAPERAPIQRSAAGDGGPRSLWEAFEAVASLNPKGEALVADDRSYTYGELLAAARLVGRGLLRAGLTPEGRVAILLDRTSDLPVALLASLATGGAYVPLDPGLPAARLAFLLDDADPDVVLVHERHRHGLPARWAARALSIGEASTLGTLVESASQPPAPVHPDWLACLMYTSGSTGQPKAVAVTHGNVLALVQGLASVSLGPGDTVLAAAPATFDASTFELWAPLLAGARCALASTDRLTPDLVADLVARHAVSVLWLTSALFNLMVDQAPRALQDVARVLTGGEALSLAHVRRAQAACPDTVFHNGYGPTETTTFVSCWPIPRPVPADWPSVPLGRPLPHVEVLLADPTGHPVPDSEPGELLVGGGGVSRGYWRRPGLTAARFRPRCGARRPGERIYATGDLARRRPDGLLEFLGRIDQQVKLRGFRIEPGEIEAALVALPEVAEAVVLLREDRPGDPRLVAYLRPTGDSRPSVEAVRTVLAMRLPPYMLPSALVWLDELPRTSTGKHDRGRLPPPIQAVTAASDPPGSATERRLATLWTEVLGAPVTSRQAHFFEAGGHSLLAARLAFRIQQEFGVRLPVTFAHTHGTLAALAGAIDAARRDAASIAEAPLRRRQRPVPNENPAPADNPSD